jgi:hypothetical protein
MISTSAGMPGTILAAISAGRSFGLTTTLIW